MTAGVQPERPPVAPADSVAAGGPLFGVLNDPVAVGAVFQENGLEFLPESFNRENAETEADLGEDLADRAVAEQGRDFLGCGEGGEDGVSTVPRPRCGAGARFALGRRGAGGARRGWRLFGGVWPGAPPPGAGRG